MLWFMHGSHPITLCDCVFFPVGLRGLQPAL